MRLLFLLVRNYPYWALPLILICLELGWVFRRRGRTELFIGFWLFSFLLFAGGVAWFYYRGDLYSNDWVRALFGL